MGSLSNLYISQSYQSLIHLGTNNTASAALIGLEDGLGNSIGVSVNTAGNLYLSGTFSASLQEGYLYVGNSSGRTIAFPTSSLVSNVDTSSLVTTSSFNQYTASTNIRLSNIELTTASVLVSINNLNAFTQSANIRLNNLESTSASVNISISNINAYTQSNDAKWQDLGNKSGSWITESETSSFARYDVSNPWSADQTFTNIFATSASFQYVKTVFETASVIYSSGSNQFGDAANDTQTLYGSTNIVNELTASGLHYPTADNGEESFMQTDGNGNLSLQYVKTLYQNIRNLETSSILKGTPLFASGSTGDNVNVYRADASNPLRMPATLIAGDNTLAASATGKGIILGHIEGVDTTGYPAGTEIYVAPGGGWTSTRPTGSSTPIQPLGIVTREGNNGMGIVLTVPPVTLPNIQTGYTWVGNGNSQPITVPTSSFIENLGGYTTTASFNAYTASNDSKVNQLINATASYAISSSVAAVDAGQDNRLNNLEGFTGSQQNLNATFATTGSNTFTGNQTIQNSLYIEEQGNPLIYTQIFQNPLINKLQISQAGASGIQLSAIDLNVDGTLTASLQEGYVWVGGAGNTSTTFATSSFVFNTGSFARTGSNTFTGDQTLIDSAGNFYTISDASGSMLLVARTFTSASAHITASASNQVNLIFKSNNNTADTVISGSDNIISNPAAPTAGFKRYVGGSGNIYLNVNSTPQISSSMAWSPSFNANLAINGTGVNSITWRGPVSSSASTFASNILAGGSIQVGTSATLTAEKATAGVNAAANLLLNGGLNIVANTATLASAIGMNSNILFGAQTSLLCYSSSMQYNSNIQNGGFVINNRYSPAVGSVTPALLARTNINTVYGIGHDLQIDGTNTSTSQTKQFIANIIAGYYISSSMGTGDNCNILATGMIGNSLIVTGSSTVANANASYSPNNTQGSMFTGRFNATDGNKAKTAETILAVGTGISGSRKTGFLIDSGSNTFVEGTLNVSGSTSISGSTTITGSISVSNVITLAGLDPLPAGATGQLAVSQSLLWFYDATQWRQVSLV